MSAIGDRSWRILSLALAGHLLLTACLVPGLHTCHPLGPVEDPAHHGEGPGWSAAHDDHEDAHGSHDHESCPACLLQSETRDVPILPWIDAVVSLFGECDAAPPAGRPAPDRLLRKVLPRAPPASLV